MACQVHTIQLLNRQHSTILSAALGNLHTGRRRSRPERTSCWWRTAFTPSCLVVALKSRVAVAIGGCLRRCCLVARHLVTCARQPDQQVLLRSWQGIACRRLPIHNKRTADHVHENSLDASALTPRLAGEVAPPAGVPALVSHPYPALCQPNTRRCVFKKLAAS